MRETATELILEQERNRIAGELHDVLAHSLTVILAQADGIRFIHRTEPETVEEASKVIAESARTALVETRRLIEGFSTEITDHPAHKAEALVILAERLSSSGMPIQIETTGEPREMTPMQHLTVYRLAQESLTNAFKHGDRSQGARMRLVWTDTSLEVRIRSSVITIRTAAPKTAPPGPRDSRNEGPRRRRRRVGRNSPRRRDLRNAGLPSTRQVLASNERLPNKPRLHAPWKEQSHDRLHRSAIALADDQPLFSAGLKMILRSQADMDLVGEAVNGADAVELVEEKSPDVLLMDIRMPVMDGITATRTILETPSSTPTKIIVLTTIQHDEAVVRAIQAGTAGFLTKDTTPDFLLAAIRTVHSGHSVSPPPSPTNCCATTRHLQPGTTPLWRTFPGGNAMCSS